MSMWKYIEEKISIQLSKQWGYSELCPVATRIATSDFINYLRVKWNKKSEADVISKVMLVHSKKEFHFLFKCWLAEWVHQWQKRVKIVKEFKGTPKKITPIPEQIKQDLMDAAIFTMINHNLLCGTNKIAESLASKIYSKYKEYKKKLPPTVWAIKMVQAICFEARQLARTSGPLLWVKKPSALWREQK